MTTKSFHDGLYNAQDAKVQKALLTTSNGAQYDLKNVIVEISYHEDIYSFCVGGYLMIRDGQGLIELLKFNGNEFIELNFDSIEKSKRANKKFLVYKIGDRRPTGNMNSEFYKLYFCSYDLFYNEQVRVGKFYKGKKISEIVRDILVNKIETVRNIEVDPTIGVYNFNHLSMLHPFAAISEISNYARPEDGGVNGTSGADMFLFEDDYGYKFKSLQTLMKQKPIMRYYYQQNNLDPDRRKKGHALAENSVIAIEFVRSYNILKDVASGAFANKIIAVNPFTKEHEYKVFDYTEFVKQVPPVNGQTIMPEVLTPRGLKPNQTPDGFVKVVMTNSGDKNSNYIKTIANTYVSQDVYIQETLSLRTAQTALANHTLLKIIVPGNTRLTVGKTIDLTLYSLRLKKENDSRDIDENYSGKYLITAVRHIVQSQGVFQTVLEIAKNSTQVKK